MAIKKNLHFLAKTPNQKFLFFAKLHKVISALIPIILSDKSLSGHFSTHPLIIQKRLSVTRNIAQ